MIGEAVRYTETGKLIGTAAYLAPEQVQGTAITPAADVYSLGLVLLELITGQLTYPGPPVEAALARLTNSPPLPADLPKRWRQLLTRMTALEPGERYTADCCAAELRALAGDPDHTRVIVPDDRPTALMDAPFADVRRRRTSLLAAAVGAFLVLIVSALVLVGRDTDRDRPRAQLPAEVAAAEIPSGVAQALRQPLQALHDAVHAIPGDTLPSMAVTLSRVDGAITRHEYQRARIQLASLVDTIEVAKANQLVEAPAAERLLAAAAHLRTALLAAQQQATSATRTTAPSGGDDGSGQDQKSGKKKSPGKGRGKG